MASPIVAALKNNNKPKFSPIIENFLENGSSVTKKTQPTNNKQPSQALKPSVCVVYRSDYLSLNSRQMFNIGKFLPLMSILVLSYIFNSLTLLFFCSTPKFLGFCSYILLFPNIQRSWHHVKTVDVLIQWLITH